MRSKNTYLIITFLLIIFPHIVSGHSDKKEIRVTLQSSKITLDPGGVRDTQSLFVSKQVNCELVRSEGSAPVLDAAESIKYLSPLKFRIKIKNDAKFHDGTPVTSKDVLASFNYIKKSKNVFNNLFTWVDKIKVYDDKTIVFYLKKEIPHLLKVLSSSNYTIYKKEFLDLAKLNSNLWDKPLGCGGYKVSTFDNNEIQLTPVAKGLPIKFYLIGRNQINANDASKYDLITVNIIGKDSILNNFRIIETFSPKQYFIGLNSKSSQWKNKYERCAFLSAISTKTLIENFNQGAINSNDLLPIGTLGYNENANYNNQLKKNSRNIKITKSIKKFCLAYLTVSIPEKNKADYINLLTPIFPNVYTMPIKNVKRFGKEFVESNCDALIMGLATNYFDGYEYLTIFEDNVANFTGINDKKLFEEITNSQSISLAIERSKAYRKIINKLAKMCVIKPLFTLPTKKIHVSKKLKVPGLGLVSVHQYFLGNVSMR